MTESRAAAPLLAFGLLVLGTILGLAGTDLVLPAVPSLPDTLGGSQAMAQMVLAAFVTGGCIGLLMFGELGARIDQRNLLVLSLAAYALVSLACMAAPSLPALVGLRFAQGLTSSAAAVFAPGMIRAMFSEEKAVGALGFMASIESLIPALAPVLGVWLLVAFGWKSSFLVLGALSLGVAALVTLLRHRMPAPPSTRAPGSYLRHLITPTFLRYALSQAFTLGGLLIFVFGAPAMITKGLGGDLGDFIIMQVTGIAFFIAGSNFAGKLAARLGPEVMILFGSVLSAAGLLGILGYALAGGTHPLALAALFVPVNLGLGFRGPPGFYRAVVAARGDDARGSALVLVAILTTTAAGTAVAAPFVTLGMAPLAAIAAAVSCASVLCLIALPKLSA
ncbi:MFS transporter [uncultured Hyphomonas sp.]|uniref:MFS transporter n=1 Tax=uncultured Hyphomonas sp. TaxID=225298 RepID=UPI000C621F00|nr:MFS transporter [Hyphomonadaceae bacterium]|tara:strand:- start:144377 stop:145552 length:1176 start_codon:yes stop_codon:yes gene_type:complete